MRILAFALAAATLLATGCGNACQDLGARLCDCTPVGTTHASCVDSVKAEIGRLNPNKDEQAVCDQYLRSCYARTDPATKKQIDFCSWIDGRCGKAACGLSEEDYATLASTPVDPNSPDGPMICPK